MTSSVAHYVAGVLDREAMVEVVTSLCKNADFHPGDRVKTLRGSLHGIITSVLEDGRVAWRPEGGTMELIALPESLVSDRIPDSKEFSP